MKRRIVQVLVAVFVLATVFSYIKESRNLVGQMPNSWIEDHKADCAVALTGGAGRVKEGFALLARGSIKKLIVSGVYPGATMRDLFPQWPFYSGLDEKDVVLEKRSGTTYGNAQQSLPLVEALHCKDVLLITSSLHMRRALKTFGTIFPDDIPVYPHSVAGGRLHPTQYELFVETVKSLFYKLWAY